MDPEKLAAALVVAVATVSSFDLLFAVLMRAERESVPDDRG